MSEITTDIGKEKIFENDKIIVWNFELQPGEETPMHQHTRSYLWYAIQGQPLAAEDEHGNDLGIFDVETDSVWDIRRNENELVIMSGDAKGMTYPHTHKARNAGDGPYREILIEFKE